MQKEELRALGRTDQKSNRVLVQRWVLGMVCAGVMRASREAQPISLEEAAPPLGSEWPVGINQARREVKRQRGEVESVSLCGAGSHGSPMPLRTGPGAQPAGQGVGVSREWADVNWEGSTRTCHSAERFGFHPESSGEPLADFGLRKGTNSLTNTAPRGPRAPRLLFTVC